MLDNLPGPSLGELRAASANMMVAGLGASPLFQQALRAAVDRQDYLLRAQTVGVDEETAERILAEIVDDRAHRNLPLTPELAYRLALEKAYRLDGPASPEQEYGAGPRYGRLRRRGRCLCLSPTTPAAQ